ncbi:MAG: DUF2779 domain-containing protein [Bacilli bacterium]
MDISKTAFKEYTRCPRVFPLEQMYLFRLQSDVNLFDDEKQNKAREILSKMFDDETGEDLLAIVNDQIEVMLPYYQEVESTALKIASETFGVFFPFFEKTKDQTMFSFKTPNHRYYTYLDGYYEDEKKAIVIEVKATTSRKFSQLGPKIKNRDEYDSIFEKQGNVFHLRKDLINENTNNRYQKEYEKLFDRFSDEGKYVFDIAVERYFVEQSLKQKNNFSQEKKRLYYLAVLNSEYEYLGQTKEGTKDYPILPDGKALIDFIDVTDITEMYLTKIHDMWKALEININEKTLPDAYCGAKCQLGKGQSCFFEKTCWEDLFNQPSVLDYMTPKSFRDFSGRKLDKFDLINEGYRKFQDIPFGWITNDNHLIQRQCFDNQETYVDKNKIKAGLSEIKYPIYHLDFESFPCPLPRFKGEYPYSQSLFQFSIHIERKPNQASEIDDHRSFLVNDLQDHREELIHSLIEVIDLSHGGTVLVYNKNFEYHQIKELARMFPEYQQDLDNICNHIFDLKDLVKTSSKLYMSLGFSEEESKKVNYYHVKLSGKYSIKKVLPLFSNRSYADLDVKNGNEAIVAYASFQKLSTEEIEEKRQQLIAYCRQDTWSMVEILNKLMLLIN